MDSFPLTKKEINLRPVIFNSLLVSKYDSSAHYKSQAIKASCDNSFVAILNKFGLLFIIDIILIFKQVRM